MLYTGCKNKNLKIVHYNWDSILMNNRRRSYLNNLKCEHSLRIQGDRLGSKVRIKFIFELFKFVQVILLFISLMCFNALYFMKDVLQRDWFTGYIEYKYTGKNIKIVSQIFIVLYHWNALCIWEHYIGINGIYFANMRKNIA